MLPDQPLFLHEPESHSRVKQAKEFVMELAKIVLISLAIIIPVRHFLIQPFYVKGASMEPNFEDHEYLIVDEITYQFRAPERGEIVVFRAPGVKQYYIKRIIGMPGETVEVKDNAMHINGALLNESQYLAQDVVTVGDLKEILGPKEYWVQGDNRSSSLDSRSFGPIKRSDIVGRAVFRGWPYSRITWFEAPKYEKTENSK